MLIDTGTESRISLLEHCWGWHVQDPSSKGVCVQVAPSRVRSVGAEDATPGLGLGRPAGSYLLVPGSARLAGRRVLERLRSLPSSHTLISL